MGWHPHSRGNLGKQLLRISVQFSHSVVSDPLQPNGPLHSRLPCPLPSPRACSNSCRWCHPNISSSVIPFSSCLESFPASGSFPMSQFFASGGQSIGFSTSTSVLPMNIQDWFPLGWTGWISLQSEALAESSPAPQFKNINSSALSFPYNPTLTSIHDYWKNHSLDQTGLCWQCNVSAFYFIFIYLFIFLFVVDFVIHWNETAMGLHMYVSAF